MTVSIPTVDQLNEAARVISNQNEHGLTVLAFSGVMAGENLQLLLIGTFDGINSDRQLITIDPIGATVDSEN